MEQIEQGVFQVNGESYRVQIESLRSVPGKPWGLTLFRRYPMYPGAKPEFYAVAFQACATKAEAGACAKAEMEKGRLFFGQYKSAA